MNLAVGIRLSTDAAGVRSERCRQLAVRAEFVLTSDPRAAHLPAETACTSTSFTSFEGTSEIQRMIIGKAVTGLDVR